MRVFLGFGLAIVFGPMCAYAAAPPPSPGAGIQWDLTPSQISTTCALVLSRAQQRIQIIDAQPLAKATFASGLGAVENTMADVNDALAAQRILVLLAVNKDVRDASTQCQQDMLAFADKINADPAIYALAQSAQMQATTQADRQLAKIYLEQGRRAGAELDATKRQRIRGLFDQLNTVQAAFERALDEDHSTIDIGKQEAASLPKDFVSTLKPAGDGYIVDVNESTAPAFLDNESAEAARERFYVAFNRRGGTANVQRLNEAVALRDQLAHLLGFDSWAAYQLDAKMARTPATVDAFLTDIDAKLLPKAREEIATLSQLKQSDDDKAPFMAWDYYYYRNKLEKTRYALDPQTVRQYFPIDNVVPAMLDIYQQMLAVRFSAMTSPVTWAPGVQEYAVDDAASGKRVGWFFLDLYPRQGKYDHFATFHVRWGRALPDGSRQLPVSVIIGNWPVGTAGSPALLTHRQVITFFHEFGHLMHNTLSTAPYETLYGFNVRGDFLEAPSQMLENWMWQPDILKRVSRNVHSGQPLPDDLIAKLIAVKHISDGYDGVSQSFYSMYDMQLHSGRPTTDPTRLWFDLQQRMTPFAAAPGTLPEASFDHLMTGYDAGYYGYLWAKVYAQDMFTVFQRAGLADTAAGMRYRTDILEPGGTVEPDVLLHRFLGRPVSYDAFYREVGIAP